MNIKSLIWSVCLLSLAALVAFTGCKPEEEEPVIPDAEVKAPVLSLEVLQVNAPADGGEFTVRYEVENPVEGVAVHAGCKAQWVSALTSGTDGLISFTVSENAGEAREAEVKVTYEGAEDRSFQVLQEAAAPVVESPFRIEVKEIRETSALLDIYPDDKKAGYLYFVKPMAELKADGIETDEQLFEADKIFLKEDAEYYGDTFVNTVNYYSHKGDCVDTQLKNLVPSSELLVYAYGYELEGDVLTRTTDIARHTFSTLQVPQIEADFQFDVQVSGAVADIKVNSGSYNGPFYFDVIEDFDENTDVTYEASVLWMKMTAILFEVGYAPADIIEQLCDFNDGEYRYELEGDKEYLVFAVAISDELALPCSAADYDEFATSGVSASENEITIRIENITSSSATLVFETTNEDPYAAALIAADEIRGMSDQEIIDLYVTDGQFNTVNGDNTVEVPGLNAGTEYTVLAFGYSGGVMTTGFFRKEFKTEAAQKTRLE